MSFAIGNVAKFWPQICLKYITIILPYTLCSVVALDQSVLYQLKWSGNYSRPTSVWLDQDSTTFSEMALDQSSTKQQWVAIPGELQSPHSAQGSMALKEANR